LYIHLSIIESMKEGIAVKCFRADQAHVISVLPAQTDASWSDMGVCDDCALLAELPTTQ
jgi:hypothetical protein